MSSLRDPLKRRRLDDTNNSPSLSNPTNKSRRLFYSLPTPSGTCNSPADGNSEEHASSPLPSSSQSLHSSMSASYPSPSDSNDIKEKDIHEISLRADVQNEMEKIFAAVSQHEGGKFVSWKTFWQAYPDYISITADDEKPKPPKMDNFSVRTHIGFICGMWYILRTSDGYLIGIEHPEVHGAIGCATFQCPKLFGSSTIELNPVWRSETRLLVETADGLRSPDPASRERILLGREDWNKVAGEILQSRMDAAIRGYNVEFALWMAKRVLLDGIQGRVIGVTKGGYDGCFEGLVSPCTHTQKRWAGHRLG